MGHFRHRIVAQEYYEPQSQGQTLAAFTMQDHGSGRAPVFLRDRSKWKSVGKRSKQIGLLKGTDTLW